MTEQQDEQYEQHDQNVLSSVVRIHYEEDNDEIDHSRNRVSEQSPLITPTPREDAGTKVSLHRTQDGSGHSMQALPRKSTHSISRHTNEQQQNEVLTTTWTEWTIKNGLHPSTWTKHTYFRALLLTTLITLVVLAFTVFRVQDRVKEILHYVDDHKSMGALLFILFYTIAIWLFLPGSLFTIGAGFLFKPIPFALAIVLVGDAFGAMGSFLFGRYIFYDWVKGMMSQHPKFNALDEVIKDDGWKIVVMLRLTPIPFNLISYFFSITSISLHTLVWATLVGVFPGSCLGIWIGSLLKGLSGIDNPELETKNIVILIMNGIFIVCSIVTLSIFGKRSLRKAMRKLDRHHHHYRPQQDHESEIDGETQEEDGGQLAPPLTDAIASEVIDAEARVVKAQTSMGFTRGEKWVFAGIAAVAVINICVCIPLYFHYASQGE
ncbi:hypothetical protein BX616_000038 [Lobosporangium transversale]|uniref:Snare associated Golgi protein-domain-containing protein n=1 Tax=Lobosporangium transversale TaxID=64571 RepID=A0A1Y2GE17_9FUNG|nr:snare associated Golgi protein-domain-containing protein [Lobosporangium transversale]KAF9919185.1 hypothetical protein BX616_000038 [Lobosporangium transversale]ORZ05156.1 snare associated Golgi protein-domain-containing protein [Lobosporangium transversale]|eukprot:XP_021876931.1 snare associated Golgi protein-domain-containing protein [Lobosporangium transversale]